MRPSFECVTRDVDGHPVALFGYESRSSRAVSILPGPRNRVSTGAPDRGQPRGFLPGRHTAAFSVRFEFAAVEWELDGHRAVGHRLGPPCKSTFELEPVADAGIVKARPDESRGAARAARVSQDELLLVEFDADQIRARAGASQFVVEAILVFKTEPGWPASLRPSLEALALGQPWTERGASWACSDRPAGGGECPGGASWRVEDGPIWYDRDGAPEVLGKWHGSSVSFDVTRDLHRFLGFQHGDASPAWVIRAAGPGTGTGLSTRESRRGPVLEVKLGPLAGAPALTFDVDPTIPAYPGEPLDAIGASGARPVATLVSPKGRLSHFVEDELIVYSDDSARVARIVADWGGVLLDSSEEFPGVPRAHVVRIAPDLAEPTALAPLVSELDPRPRGQHRVSSRKGIGLLAAAAQEATVGTLIGVNWVGSDDAGIDFDAVRDRSILDGQSLVPGAGLNALGWPHMSVDPEVRSPAFGVGNAWLRLFFMKQLTPEFSRVAIIDRGFRLDFLTGELPPWELRGTCSNEVTGCAAGEWHGTKVAQAGFGVPGNGFAAAGPGGPVSALELNHRSLDLSATEAGIRSALNRGASIVNVSRTYRTHAALTFTMGGYNRMTALGYGTGSVLVGSAGNDARSVDAEDCFLFVCWEEEWHSPCENDGVICVGGVDERTDQRAPKSNWGSENVDIWGPYVAYTGGPTPDSLSPRSAFALTEGTSLSAPFVAGVAALVNAADDPDLYGYGPLIWRRLRETSSPSSDSRVKRIVHADEAVRISLQGFVNYPPRVRILTPSGGTTLPSLQFNRYTAEAIEYRESGTVTPNSFSWTSSLDGPMGSGSTLDAQLFATGTHVVSVRVCNNIGCWTDEVTVDVVRTPPTVVITEPAADGAAFPSGLPVTFSATATDGGFFPCDQVMWDGDVQEGATGCTVRLLPLNPGVNRIRARAVALDGLSGSAERAILVGAATDDLRVRIASPVLDSTRGATIFAHIPVQLDALRSGGGGALTSIGWFLNTQYGMVPVASELSTTWFPSRAELPRSCGGYTGTLAVLIVSEDGQVAGDLIPIFVSYPPC